ncbi:MAG: ATP-binding cassette domain-containing protein [Candidatus Aminicenantes bacterium]|nr:ATP-binding cassette domain-containing protein [Candidatus Aminicenantes bacterium]NIM83362.1 ATP-binding cassette domain-containing protein [Candidatus Aminicenantes bacterium]NIN22726.1 ATP-binding cassette domain-containing protein [Candidatus Aminicenantes bacterium]NIN46486.1 ATP-binding cassette domain-containing protein [Candidatus Aminicenantes bacterium]NIN89368.1 ATP-binding cassette domain-containing protein [Candidatus Aminicenantes bacterium]
MKAVINTENLSKWYGNVLGISEISLEITSGIKGLLGPNGAGKSTFLKILCGQLKPNIGTITILGEPVFSNYPLFSRIGFCPEHECYYRGNTGWQQVVFMAKLHGFDNKTAAEKAEAAIDKVGLLDAKDKLIREYSMGMKQRLKFAASIVHDPEVLLLDEPMRGIDPLWRVKIVQLIKEFGKAGKTVIVASHILPEIEIMTNDIILIHQGKVFAQGDIHYIRNLMDSHPHMISVECTHPRKLAGMMLDRNYILNVNFHENDREVTFNTNKRDQFFDLLNRLIVEHDIDVTEIFSPDDNLQAVFDYLVGR